MGSPVGDAGDVAFSRGPWSMVHVEAERRSCSELTFSQFSYRLHRAGMAEGLVVLDVKGLSFRHEPGRPQVDDVSVTLREGQTFGVLGANECGKTTLAQLLLGNLVPESGSVNLLGVPLGQRRPSRWRFIVHLLLAACAVVVAALAAVHPALLMTLRALGAWSLPLLLMLLEIAHHGHRALWPVRGLAPMPGATDSGRAPASLIANGVAYMSSEHDGGQKLPANQTVEDAIAQDMPLPKAARAERRREVQAALEASGFRLMTDSGTPVGNPEQYLSDGLKCGELSGGQRHLVYLLSVIASRPRLLICDECLCSLDIDRQSSMLTLLQRLQMRYGMAIVFLTVDLTSFSLMCAQEGAYMRHGKFLERGLAHDIVERPQRKDTQVYVTLSQENEARSHGKNLRAAYQNGESVFAL